MGFDTADHELGKIAQDRLSALMREERKNKNRSIRTLARKLKIKRKHIKKWESGKGCPPGPIMMAIFDHYGKASMSHLQRLDLELQHMKYERTIARMNAAMDIRKLPAVIWAEEVQFARAA